MCGIIGYVGPRDASKVVVEGLRRMEYRGYDSAGVAVIADGAIDFRKKAGKISNLDAEIAGDPLADTGIGIGHTRWATHGGPTDYNAHPHVSANGRVALIHNGIIENFAPLRSELEAQGVVFRSETDTEVAAQLLGKAVEDGTDLADAMR
ncbi:MAG: glutamine--fructose-6-phosphate aminotransferase, partial [Propionibacterium sp.]|nr:glutamine--fructose-6-phosphate aminotransferase [Propionibacterium sp.]